MTFVVSGGAFPFSLFYYSSFIFLSFFLKYVSAWDIVSTSDAFEDLSNFNAPAANFYSSASI